MSTNNGQYDTPATFVNVKRVRQAQDSKGREQLVLTFGLTKGRNGEEINTADALIDALEQYRGKQVNLDVRIEEKDSGNGRTFPSAFVRVVEMIPKGQGGGTGRTQFVSKGQAAATKAKNITKQFAGGSGDGE